MKSIYKIAAGVALLLASVMAEAQGTLAYTNNPSIVYGLRYRGAYSGTYNYGLYDVVVAGSNAYVSIVVSNLANLPSASPSDWTPLAVGVAGATGAAGSAGAAGAAGATGPTGAAGPAGTVAVGSVGAVANGTAPTVANVGTASAAILNFTLETGPAGATGSAGSAGAAGATGPTGSAGAAGATGPAGPVPACTGIVYSNSTVPSCASTTQMQTAIGSGVYDTAGLASTVQTNLTAEATTARAAEGSNATAIATETTNRGTAVTAEASTRSTADTTNATAIASEATTARAAEGSNATAIATETSNRGTAVTAAQAAAQAASDPLGTAATAVAPNINTTGLLAYDFFNAADYASGAGVTLHDQSGLGNNCTVTLGTNVAWSQIANAYALNWGATNTTTNMINCPSIVVPYAVTLIYKATASFNFGNPMLGYSNTSVNFSAYTQAQTSQATQPMFILNVTGAVSSMTQPTSYNAVTFNLTPTINSLTNTVYNGVQNLPSLNPAYYNNTNVSPSGGNLQIMGTTTTGFTGGLAARDTSLIGYIVYGTPGVSAAQVQQNYAAATDYFAKRGIDITQHAGILSAQQNFNVTATGSSIDAGFSSQPPSSYMTGLASTYTVNNSAVSSSGTVTRDISYANTELYWANPRAGRNVLFIGAPTNDICEASGYLESGNSSEANAWAGMLSLADKALHPKAIDGKTRQGYDTVILGTMISRTGNAATPNTGTCEAAKQIYNGIARAAAFPPEVFLGDIAEIAVLGADGANNGTPGTIITTCPGATTYFNSDCVHPNTTGSPLYGAAMQAEIQANTGYTTRYPNVQTTTYSMTPGDRAVLASITAATTFTLPPCQGLTTYDYYLNNPTAFALTVAPNGSDTITGSTTITGGSGTYRAMLTSATLGGCYWLATSATPGVATITVTVPTGTLAANTCSSATTATMTGLAIGQIILPGYATNPAGLTGWGSTAGIVFNGWASAANTMSWALCNQTSASITYSGITLLAGVK